MRVAPRACMIASHARDLVGDFLGRAVGLAQQDRRGVGSVAGVHELLDRERGAAWSIISRPAGMMPAAITLATAAPAFSTSSKAAITTCAHSGFGRSFTVTSVTTASMPSEPTASASRS